MKGEESGPDHSRQRYEVVVIGALVMDQDDAGSGLWPESGARRGPSNARIIWAMMASGERYREPQIA